MRNDHCSPVAAVKQLFADDHPQITRHPYRGWNSIGHLPSASCLLYIIQIVLDAASRNTDFIRNHGRGDRFFLFQQQSYGFFCHPVNHERFLPSLYAVSFAPLSYRKRFRIAMLHKFALCTILCKLKALSAFAPYLVLFWKICKKDLFYRDYLIS